MTAPAIYSEMEGVAPSWGSFLSISRDTAFQSIILKGLMLWMFSIYFCFSLIRPHTPLQLRSNSATAATILVQIYPFVMVHGRERHTLQASTCGLCTVLSCRSSDRLKKICSKEWTRDATGGKSCFWWRSIVLWLWFRHSCYRFIRWWSQFLMLNALCRTLWQLESLLLIKCLFDWDCCVWNLGEEESP